jgi:ribosomal protein L23
MDFQKLKVFGFPRAMTKFRHYLPSKIEYLRSKDFGYFETPKNTKNKELRILYQKYKQRLEYEKYMNPLGLKYSYTSNFPKIAPIIDMPNPKAWLVRTDKVYRDDEIKFLVDKKMSKPEIKHFVQNVYNINVQKVSTAILPGQIKIENKDQKRNFIRTRDRKKAVIKLDFKVDKSYRKIENKQD